MARVTDDERRRAAASLRKIRSGWASGTCYYAIINALGYPDTSREDGGHALYSLLADLIEPRDMSHGCRDTVACDREALLALADDVDGAADDSGGFEPLAGMLRDIARHIRVACGEES